MLVDRIAEWHARPETHRVKAATPIGCGETPDVIDRMALVNSVDLLRFESRRDRPEYPCSAAQVTMQIYRAMGYHVLWSGEHDEFLLKCANLVKRRKRQMALDRLNPTPANTDFGDFGLRYEFTVALALPSRAVTTDAYITLHCINHHSGKSLEKLLSL